jgi:ferritin-like metal-binding protein YciE
MGEHTSNGQTFERDLQALWSAEKQLTQAMPLMIERASNLGLKKNLALHLAETHQHKVAIEAICKQLGFAHESEENAEIKSLVEQGEREMSIQVSDGKVDAAIIAGAIKIEHYEISRYEEVANAAEALGFEGVAKRLRLTLEEERQADAKLNFLDKNYVQESSLLGGTQLALK